MTQTEDAYGDLIPYWKAPELLKHGPHTMATDIYAFGMLLRCCFGAILMLVKAQRYETTVTAFHSC